MEVLLITLTFLYLAKGFHVAESQSEKHGHHPMWVLAVILWPIVNSKN